MFMRNATGMYRLASDGQISLKLRKTSRDLFLVETTIGICYIIDATSMYNNKEHHNCPLIMDKCQTTKIYNGQVLHIFSFSIKKR